MCVCVCVWVMRWCEKKTKELWDCCRILSLTWHEWCIGQIYFSVYMIKVGRPQMSGSHIFLSSSQRAQIKKMELWRHQQRQQGIVFSPLSSRHIYILFASNTYNNWLNENICASLRSFKHENQNIYFSIKLLTIYKWVIFYIHTFPLYHEVCIYTVIFS